MPKQPKPEKRHANPLIGQLIGGALFGMLGAAMGPSPVAHAPAGTRWNCPKCQIDLDIIPGPGRPAYQPYCPHCREPMVRPGYAQQQPLADAKPEPDVINTTAEDVTYPRLNPGKLK